MNFYQWALYGGSAPEDLSPVEARKLRLWRYCQWLMLLVLGLFALMAYAQQIHVRMIWLSAAWLLCLLALLLVRPAHRHWSMNVTMLGVSIGVIVGCTTNGGLGSVASGWLIYLPLLAGVMGGVALVRPWIVFTGTIFIVLIIVDLAGVQFPNLTRPEFQRWQDLVQLAMQGIAVVMTLLGLTGQVMLSEATMARTIAALNAEVVIRKEAERKAVDAEQKKAAFFTSMSHELRTPLNAILGFTRMVIKQLAGKGVDERGEDALRRVLSNGQDLLSLVNNLLTIAKSTRGEFSHSLQQFDLHYLIAEVLADVSCLVDESINAENTCDGTLKVSCCMETVRRILVNLIGNALKYTERGRVTLSSCVDQDWVSVKVSDTGPGIAKVDMAYLFEPYTRGTSAAANPGTGLGLALCQQWAKELQGEIGVSTTVGQGSTFTLYLPKAIVLTE